MSTWPLSHVVFFPTTSHSTENFSFAANFPSNVDVLPIFILTMGYMRRSMQAPRNNCISVTLSLFVHVFPCSFANASISSAVVYFASSSSSSASSAVIVASPEYSSCPSASKRCALPVTAAPTPISTAQSIIANFFNTVISNPGVIHTSISPPASKFTSLSWDLI